MITSRHKEKCRNKQNIIIINYVSYERVDKFIYLGSLITGNNEISAEIKERLAKGNRCIKNVLNKDT
jgi:hypothetical protein